MSKKASAGERILGSMKQDHRAKAGKTGQTRSLRILLDECLPIELKATLAGHSCTSVVHFGYLPSRKKESLLQFANGIFDVFITLGAPQSLDGRKLRGTQTAVIALSARSNRLEDLEPLAGKILVALKTIEPGQVVHVRDDRGVHR